MNLLYKVYKQFFRIGVFIALVISTFVLLTPSLPVYAQGGVAGFSQCQFRQTDGSQTSIQACLQQIFQFTFVLGMFIIAIRVAIIAIGNYNPFDNGRADNQAIQLVWEVTLGLILIGGPVILVNTINPAALNLDFLNIGNLAPSGNSGGIDVINGDGNVRENQEGSGDTPPATSLDHTSERLEEDNATLTETGTPGRDTLNGIIFFARAFQGTTANAQGNEIIEAENRLRSFLKLESKCNNLFVTQTQLNDCRVIETQDFITARNNLSATVRETLTPLEENQMIFSGTYYAQTDLEIRPVTIQPTLTKDPSCNTYYAVVRPVGSKRDSVVSTIYCGAGEINSAFWNPETREPKAGTTLTNGTQVNFSGQILYLRT